MRVLADGDFDAGVQTVSWNAADDTGRRFSLRGDGTVVLPAGARSPDFTIDEMQLLARARVAELRQTVRS